ncbi:MAG TPA: tetratricopeptide repeat protein, partial [Candidatus Desulfofervidus auxilii]|nr:tetratricopeptide repeat protein [Candidatus Desulfofervidus auxilii]
MRFIMKILIVFFFAFLSLFSWAQDCKKTIKLYNEGTICNDLAKKQELFKKALTLPCNNKEVLAKIHNNLADTYERQGRIKEAIKEYKKAIALDPTLSTPYLSLGDIYTKIGKLKKAKQYYEKGSYLDFLSKMYKSKEEIIASLSPKRAIKEVPCVNIYFGFDKAVLTKEAKKQLNALLEALSSGELCSYKFLLAGHTCSIGTPKYNQGLSERRANSVKDWLIKHGISEDRLVTIGYGEDRPMVPNDTEENRRLNRRVEIRTIGIVINGIKRSTKSIEGIRFLKEGERLFIQEKYKEAVSRFKEALRLFDEDNFYEGSIAALMDLS